MTINETDLKNGGRPIMVWPFDHAPAVFRAMSEHGGDEDWVELIPPEYAERYIGWIEAGGFGVSEVSEYEVNGWIVRIGAHA